jgi:hypothetical protein
MRLFTLRIVATLGIVGAFPQLGAEETNVDRDFARLKALVGVWEGVSSTGKSVRASYRLVADGSCLIEEFSHSRGAKVLEMVTVYHRDVDKLMLTHYCTLNNQPRMTAKRIADDVGEIDFTIIDATNVSPRNPEHMCELVIRFRGEDRFDQVWHWKGGADGAGEELFTFKRKAPSSGTSDRPGRATTPPPVGAGADDGRVYLPCCDDRPASGDGGPGQVRPSGGAPTSSPEHEDDPATAK